MTNIVYQCVVTKIYVREDYQGVQEFPEGTIILESPTLNGLYKKIAILSDNQKRSKKNNRISYTCYEFENIQKVDLIKKIEIDRNVIKLFMKE